LLLPDESRRLSKEIARRWNLLSESGREFYINVAAIDQAEYKEYIKNLAIDTHQL
jgi:hypothetical protein